MTYKELIYMILDELKLYSDDSDFNELHIKFLCSKYRAFLLKQTYSNIKKTIPDANKQTICLDLELVPVIESLDGISLKSKDKVPNTLSISTPEVSPHDYVLGHTITYIPLERFRYTGYTKWLKNMIYCCKGSDNYLHFKSLNPQHLHLERVQFTGVFEDVEEAAKLACRENKDIDIMDTEFPIEEALIPQLIQAVVQELAPKTVSPADQDNNASDDKSSIYNYMARNVKSDLAKQLS